MFLVDWFIVLRAQFKVDWKPQKNKKQNKKGMQHFIFRCFESNWTVVYYNSSLGNEKGKNRRNL